LPEEFMDLMQAYGMENDRVEKIICLTERIKRIDSALDSIRYNNELYTEIPEAVKVLGAAKDACMAELKTI